MDFDACTFDRMITKFKISGEIAQECGFCSAAYFTEVFTRSEPVPPENTESSTKGAEGLPFVWLRAEEIRAQV